MKCPDRGLLKAYADAEVSPEALAIVEAHLASCPACRQALAAITRDTALARRAFTQAFTADDRPAPDARLALARTRQALWERESFWDRIRKGGRDMIGLRNTASRVAAAAVVICLCLVGVFSFEPARSGAEGFLAVFRVEKFQTVTVDVNSMPTSIPVPSDLGTLHEPTKPKSTPVRSMSEAQDMVPFDLADLSTPEGYTRTSTIVTAPTEWAFTFDGAKLKAYLNANGVSHLILPKNIDGATIRVTTSAVVSTSFRHGAPKVGPSSGSLQFIQTTSPTIETPSDLDVDLLRTQILSSGLLPADLSRQLASIEDWQKTAIIPIPSDASSKQVSVNGAPGTLFSDGDYGAVLIWQRGDVICGLAGPTSPEELLNIALTVK